MGKYRVDVEFSGYVRGMKRYIIEANSEEEARENFFEGECVINDIHRDDTEKEVRDVIKLN